MVQLPKRPYLSWDQLASKADRFADEYHLAERSYPVDIEEPAEAWLGQGVAEAAPFLQRKEDRCKGIN